MAPMIEFYLDAQGSDCVLLTAEDLFETTTSGLQQPLSLISAWKSVVVDALVDDYFSKQWDTTNIKYLIHDQAQFKQIISSTIFKNCGQPNVFRACYLECYNKNQRMRVMVIPPPQVKDFCGIQARDPVPLPGEEHFPKVQVVHPKSEQRPTSKSKPLTLRPGTAPVIPIVPPPNP